jgi:hypothetical protein
MIKPLETCCRCDEPTGKAGAFEDSLYCTTCWNGPFCEGCYEQHVERERLYSEGAIASVDETERDS